MLRKICEISCLSYGDSINGTLIPTEPTKEDIQKAIDGNNLEDRNYQLDFENLKAEWIAGSGNLKDLDVWGRTVREYHARRIAYFVVKGWERPIAVKKWCN